MAAKFAWLSVALFGLALLAGCGTPTQSDRDSRQRLQKPADQAPDGHHLATFGGGCFWCTEAVFQQLNGVHSAVPGYSGGTVTNPTYEEVCRETTGHAEVVQVAFDPKVISYAELLEVFWQTHDPTTLNRQGADRGARYRSVVFYHNDEQKKLAESYKTKLDASGAFNNPIVTKIDAYTEFYPAEKYHHDFFVKNPEHGYCAAVIVPKLEKFEKVFKDKLKPASKQ